MRPEPIQSRQVLTWKLAAVPLALLALAALYAACASSSSTPSAASASPAGGPVAFRSPGVTTAAPSPDPRVGLRPGRADQGRRILEKAAEASWNLRLISNSPPTEGFIGVTNSDLAFIRNYAIQGNYNGYQVWDLSNPRSPTLASRYHCPASQSDVSVYRNILFVSAEAASARLDCGDQGDTATVSQHRLRGIRIFDATDIRNPRYIGNVQTCRGSHTHTVVSDPRDPNVVYVYISGSSRVRPEGELTGCSDLDPENSPTSANFRIEVIRVPLANPDRATLVSAPRIFQDLAPAPRSAERAAQDSAEAAARRGGGGGGGGGGAGRRGGAPAGPPAPRTGPTQCHDITVYPAIGLAGGACGGYGLLLDIRDVANPRRIDAVADPNMSFWHSATFSNDGSKILFTDEWGGGGSPKCRSTDKYEWGANALFNLRNNKMTFTTYYKMPAAQTAQENCVAHNGSLIPIPGREVMVQGWYQGGISIFDWTDPARPYEIAFHDRGPLDAERMMSAGSWSVYWYNGLIVSSEIARGLDIFELVPSAFLTQNEIDAANTVRFEWLNAQEQPKITWPPSFPLTRAYLDQLERSRGLSSDRIASVRSALSAAERQSGQARRDALSALAAQLHTEANSSSDAPKAHMLAGAIGDLANAQR